MPEQTIARQVDTFNEGFTAQIGPTLTAVFDGEQADLRAAGTPDGTAVIGRPFPTVELTTPTGERTTVDAVRADAPVVVVFYRGAWCPYCNIALRTYQQELLPALRERGVGLVAVSPQTPSASEQSIRNGELGFPVLSDPGNVLAGTLGIVTEPSDEAKQAHAELGFAVADSNADGTAAVPFPSVFVLDAAGVVRSADVHVD
ncbi:MAG: AhpC/TSA family protein, partial [Williamsia herbipolensis]|nr:AhpC/TSA family protein [Williamsia herbipolensis]